MSSRQRDQVRQLIVGSARGRGRDIRGLAAWSIIEAVPAFFFGRLVAYSMDEGFLIGNTTRGFAWLGLLGLLVLVGAWATRQAYLRLAALVEPFRDQLVSLTVGAALHRSTSPGGSPQTGAVARLTQHVEIVREAYAVVLMVTQTFLVTAVSALLGLAGLVPAALPLVLVPVCAGLAIFGLAMRPMAARQKASILAEERISETATIMADARRDIAACGGEPIIEAMVGEHIDGQARATRDLARLTAVRTLAVAIGGWLPVVLILVAGPWLLRRGATQGAILGALAYVMQGVQPALQTLVRQFGEIGLWLLVTLRRIVDATDLSDLAVGPLGETDRRARWHDVVVDHVTFGYGERAEPVMRDLDLVIPEGEHLVVVGPSGVGKSTLAGLITGLLVPRSGQVRIGGVPVTEMRPEVLARHRVLIPQEAYVFSATLGENLTYLRPDATSAQIDEAVAAIGLRPIVDRVGGYHAQLDPASFSAGERQLLTLTRAFLSPARLIVLDEATCHLDPGAEARVERAFSLRPGTLVVIAHRISSAQRARRILVMDGPEIVLGTHAELLTSSALYRDLVGHWAGAGRQ